MINVKNIQQSMCLPQYLTLIFFVRNIVINCVNFYPSSLNATISVKDYYSCLLSTVTIEYSCLSLCVSVCVSACVHNNSKNNGSIQLKLEHVVVYENSWEEFDIGNYLIKVKSRHDFEIFLHLPQYKLSNPISQLYHMLGSCD